ncbi:MAG: CDP-diacylglycerol--glycerol-3-phosphate 3-phosphatidyltransferase [Rhodospirillales bacterium]|nr:CDP-diacylglycerol--glycerol-3-phosphate 3-phosphatidyltransferase [Rhodospirillales bacterium]
MSESSTLNAAMLVTCGRIVLVVPFVACFYLPGPWGIWGAGGIFVVAGISDALDGWMARRLNIVTELGAILDPVADKIMHAAALIMLAADGRVPALAAAILIARDLMIGGLRQMEESRGVLAVSPVAKVKTALQFLALSTILLAPGVTVAEWLATAGLGLLWISVALSVWSGSLYTLRVARFLNSERT